MFTGPGSLNSCVEGQQIGLAGNGGNGINNVADFLGTLTQLGNNICSLLNSGGYFLHFSNGGFNYGITLFCLANGLLGMGNGLVDNYRGFLSAL